MADEVTPEGAMEPGAPNASEEGFVPSAAEILGGAPAEASASADAELPSPGSAPSDNPLDMEFILDIPLRVTVEVGRTKLLVQDLLQLGQGSVIELDKQMGEPFEVLVNQKLVARGEIVVVNDRFGVRLTDIVSPAERVRSLA